MRHIDLDQGVVFPGAGGTSAPTIYVVDMPASPFDLQSVSRGRFCTLATVTVSNWDDGLTPWPAPGLYRGDAAFKGEAAITLDELIGEAIPAIERKAGLAPVSRAICGYSLGGLFALYALAHSAAFRACGCLSGSVWYEGWVEHLRGLDLDGAGRFAFLSIGSREKHAMPPILHTVQDNMAACSSILENRGFAVEYRVGPGSHTTNVHERFEAGLSALDAFMREGAAS